MFPVYNRSTVIGVPGVIHVTILAKSDETRPHDGEDLFGRAVVIRVSGSGLLVHPPLRLVVATSNTTRIAANAKDGEEVILHLRRAQIARHYGLPVS